MTINKTMNEALLFCGQLLIKKHLTIAFAESATAGRIAAEFSLVPDAGKFLKGGIVCYDACLKTSLLDVPETLLKSCSPESAEVTHAIATGLHKLIPADIRIGCTGLTCPGGSESPGKPVGTMFVCGISNQDLLFAERFIFSGKPEEIVLKTVEKVALLIIDSLGEPYDNR
jgi:nicotinamide-nucleotide amidase